MNDVNDRRVHRVVKSLFLGALISAVLVHPVQ